ncbi:asparagine synthase (glutamine-hydrolyzing) [Acetobacter sp.]|uniref:asparagine synthase (glutamine-hydrolyzing) n=1 Tax=Acetobacter sp. TaxID=440 RepID=UPI0039E7F913
MCGIGGIVYRPGAPLRSEETLQRLAGALSHRGPDGTHIERLGRADLVHTRLAIIDIAGGDQPLHAGSATLIANGEIYNDPQIRDQLGNQVFTTGSDCESPLRLWEREGRLFADDLRGMYAIALYDSAEDRLFLVRDPFGIKPLYYSLFPDGLAFASEPKALIAAGLGDNAEDAVKRDELLQLQFTTGGETIFPGIYRVLPGEMLEIQHGDIVGRTRRQALPRGASERITEEKALERLDTALINSVQAHERSDVPFGLFLSGGIDSATVLAAMARVRREHDGNAPLLAWTAGFDVPGAADETAHAAALARSAGAEHRILRVTKADFWTHLPAIVASMDDSVADYAIVPTWLLAREARQEATVILSGEGGDELFAGYGRYRSAARPWWRGGRKMRRHGAFHGLGVLRETSSRWRDGLAAAERETRGLDRLTAAQAVDIAEWLPNDLLLKLDRCLMAHGLEGRTPLLDPVVAEAVWRLPDDLKIRGKYGKYLLRRWVEREMPVARPFAPKQGFTVPVGAWIKEQGARLGQLIAAQPAVVDIAHPTKVETLFRSASGRRERHAAWALLFYAVWHRVQIEGKSPEGDVFEVLSAR